MNDFLSNKKIPLTVFLISITNVIFFLMLSHEKTISEYTTRGYYGEPYKTKVFSLFGIEFLFTNTLILLFTFIMLSIVLFIFSNDNQILNGFTVLRNRVNLKIQGLYLKVLKFDFKQLPSDFSFFIKSNFLSFLKWLYTVKSIFGRTQFILLILFWNYLENKLISGLNSSINLPVGESNFLSYSRIDINNSATVVYFVLCILFFMYFRLRLVKSRLNDLCVKKNYILIFYFVINVIHSCGYLHLLDPRLGMINDGILMLTNIVLAVLPSRLNNKKTSDLEMG